MKVLGIETSCDETAAAVVEDGSKILSSIVASQISIHRKYGGIVPELASRKHVESIVPVINEALSVAGITLDDIEGVAVTQGPGLVGSLLVGICVAKSIAYVKNLPLTSVNHVEGHIFAAFMEERVPSFPLVALVVSGGHTNLYYVSDFTTLELMGQTRDDAAGEAFDKVAKLLNLGYPGGIIIDRLSKEGNTRAIDFPRAYIEKDPFDFSFSGLKTAVVNYVKKNPKLISRSSFSPGLYKDTEGSLISVADLVASFQEAVVDVLVSKTIRAAQERKVNQIVVAGGVASNTHLRTRLKEEAQNQRLKVYVPRPELCTDNAAMVAACGYYQLKKGIRSSLDFDAISRIRGFTPADC